MPARPLRHLASSRSGRALGATACFILLAGLVAAPALSGRTALRPEQWFDLDPLYRSTPVPDPDLPRWTDWTPIWVDTPRDLTFARGLQDGRVDAWAPLVGCGAPLWAEQGGPFFPLKLPFYLAPSPRSYDLFLTLRLVLAALGAYALARARGLAPLPAVAAGATFELSGALLDFLAFGASSAYALLPWVVLGADRIARRPGGAAVAGAAVALGVAGHGGHPGVILLVYATFAAAIAGHLLAAWRVPRAAGTVVLAAGLAVGLGLALAAPALLPLVELTQHGRLYKVQMAGDSARLWMLRDARATFLPGLFAPAVLQSLRTAVHVTYAAGPMIGVTALVLAVVGMLAGRLGPSLRAVGALGVVLALHPPGFGWLRDAPGLQLISAYYTWPVLALPLTQAVGRGVEVVSTAGGRRQTAIALALVCTAALSLWGVRDLPLSTLAQELTLRRGIAAPYGTLRLVGPYVLALLAVTGAAAVARRGRAVWCGLGLVLLATGEQLALALPFVHQPRSTRIADLSPAVGYLRQALASGDWRFMGLRADAGMPITPMLLGLRDLRALGGLPVRRYVEYLDLIDPRGSVYVTQQVGVPTSVLLDLASVRFLVAPRGRGQEPPPLLGDDITVRRAYADERVAIYQNFGALPRVRLVHGARPCRDPAEARAVLAAWNAAGRHAGLVPEARTQVAIEPDEEGRPAPTPAPATSSDEWVRLRNGTAPDQLDIEAHLDAPGLVVVADTYYPGWRAWIDDAPTPIYPANLMFRAVFVPAGTHTIRMRYHPQPLRRGIWCFGLAAVLCVGLRWWRPAGRRS